MQEKRRKKTGDRVDGDWGRGELEIELGEGRGSMIHGELKREFVLEDE